MLPEAVARIASLLTQLDTSVLAHVFAFAKALVEGDTEKAKRAATSAATERIFKAPVQKPTTRKPGT
jgi:hypothetical protein